MADKHDRPLRIAIVVPNPCDPDYRVIKQADALAAAGHTVRVYATRRKGALPAYEKFGKVHYYREVWNVIEGLISYISGAYRRPPQLEAQRKEYAKYISRAQRRNKRESGEA